MPLVSTNAALTRAAYHAPKAQPYGQEQTGQRYKEHRLQALNGAPGAGKKGFETMARTVFERCRAAVVNTSPGRSAPSTPSAAPLCTSHARERGKRGKNSVFVEHRQIALRSGPHHCQIRSSPAGWRAQGLFPLPTTHFPQPALQYAAPARVTISFTSCGLVAAASASSMVISVLRYSCTRCWSKVCMPRMLSSIRASLISGVLSSSLM